MRNKVNLSRARFSNNPILSSLYLRNINLVNVNDHGFDNTPQLNCISVDNLIIAIYFVFSLPFLGCIRLLMLGYSS